MAPISPEKLRELQSQPSCVRNICILAHVDHGKTSLSDCLLASNGIISQKMAGKVRYLDSREDEQIRGITMESSAISLYFKILQHNNDGTDEVREHLINLIDSPGHIDFSSEVSTASRLCDGALVLVDAVEGVCSQTVTVLRQAYLEHIKPVLVINKIDRLITELKLTPYEAYTHMSKVLEKVNAVMGSFFASERMEEEVSEEHVEMDDEHLYFAPEANNVIFASAIDGWGFTVQQFAVIYEKKLGMNRAALEKVLWGDYYFDPKTKKVLTSKTLKGRNLKPFFVQFVLENIWAVYDCTVVNRDSERTEKVVKALNVKVLPRDLRSKDTRALLTAIFSQWLPLSTSVLVTVINQIPPPTTAQRDRIPTILESTPGSDRISPELKEAMLNCDAAGPVAAFVSKMVAIPEDELPKNKRTTEATTDGDDIRERLRKAREAANKAKADAMEREGSSTPDGTATAASVTLSDMLRELNLSTEETDEPAKKEAMIGFARLYSGTLTVGQELYVLGPKFNPMFPDKYVTKCAITDLYLLMGRELIALDTVPCGNVVGIGGLEGAVLKNGSLFSVSGGVNLAGVNLSSAPIVRVALEPERPSELPQLERGLRLLNQADPCVQIIIQETGEHVILTAGELHLERCLKDLRERFARIEIQSSKPIVPYRESIVRAPEMNPPKNAELPRGTVIVNVGASQASIRLSVRPLPAAVTEVLNTYRNAIRFLRNRKASGADDDDADEDDEGPQLLSENGTVKDVELQEAGSGEFNDDEEQMFSSDKLPSLDEFRSKLAEAFAAAEYSKEVWNGVVDKICEFGPQHVGANVLIDGTVNQFSKHLLSKSEDSTRSPFQDSIITAFQLATAAGPLCAEPMQGVAVFIENIEITRRVATDVAEDIGTDTALQDGLQQGDDGQFASNLVARHSGQIITSTRDAIRQGFLDWSPRILLAMYKVEIQAPTDVLGRVYSVIAQRRGRIASEEMKEGTPFFSIHAVLPVVESFGLAEDIRKRSSGAASPQLIFAGFEMLDEDPFWVPTTEEELEHLGEIADKENIAKKYMDAVRRRKGLFVEEKLVKNAEKQRTLKK
ncbi:P-loop containing nucleoside triphosphate hydrolase protein [Lipomyces kononenkoae]|uniref:P-loop containing nucleoside triphosphate hydrolase protein n=1 Tax=Lipomyces kononenkoae TaxID=34357 RepID=A0ACC3SUH9_LIPKO